MLVKIKVYLCPSRNSLEFSNTYTARTGIGDRVWFGLLVLGYDWSYVSHFFEKTTMSQRKSLKENFLKLRFSF